MYGDTLDSNRVKEILHRDEKEHLIEKMKKVQEEEELEKKYNALIADVHNWMAATDKIVTTSNYQNIKHGGEVNNWHWEDCNQY